MPDSLGRDKKSENTRNARGLCFIKECKRKPVSTITYYGNQVKVCKPHEGKNGVR